MFRKRKNRNTHHDLAQAERSLKRAQADREAQERKRQQEQEGVISRLDRIERRNNVADLIRHALQQGGRQA